MTAKKTPATPENEMAEEMTFSYVRMPNLSMERRRAAHEAGTDTVPEPAAHASPAEPSPADRTTRTGA